MLAQKSPLISLPAWLTDPHTAAYVAAGLLALWLLRRVRRMLRARRPPKIHPRLAAYMTNDPSLLAQRRADAAGILATSSTDRVAGYEIVRQIEAVFEDGHRSPADAVETLKAVASRRGANAVINLTQERTSAGRCTARGDAVVIRPLIPNSAPPAPEKGDGSRS